MPEYDEPQINEDQIKMALTAARDLSTAEGARRQDSTLRDVGHAEHAEIRANRRAAQNLLLSSFIKAGFELDKFEELTAQNRSALRRLAEKQKAEVVENSSSVKDTLRHGVDTRRKTMEQLANHTDHGSTDLPVDADPDAIHLARPIDISADPPIVFPRRVGDKHIEPGNSWAKFRFTASGIPYPMGFGDRHAGLTFYFLWTNPRDTYTVINVGTTLTLNGYCEASSEGMWYGESDRYSHLRLYAGMTPREWWNQPPTTRSVPSQLAVELGTATGGWFEEDASECAAVSGVYWLGHNLMVVPPRAVAGFEVMCAFEFKTGKDSGLIEVDFASGDFEVMCPGVYLQIVS